MDKKVVDYLILRGSYIDQVNRHLKDDELERKIFEHLKHGWILYGDPFVYNDAIRQAMIMCEE